jgi:hypothetical protein
MKIAVLLACPVGDCMTNGETSLVSITNPIVRTSAKAAHHAAGGAPEVMR